jgi:two-component system sensor histidine kinase KdpD
VTGAIAAGTSVAAATAVIYPLKQITPLLSLVVLYVLAVVVVAAFWGLALGVATSLLSAAAFNFFHLPPHGRFVLADDRDWAALLVFVVVAVATGLVADLALSAGAGRAAQRSGSRRGLARVLLGADGRRLGRRDARGSGAASGEHRLSARAVRR